MNEALVCFFLVFLAFIFFIVLVSIDVYAYEMTYLDFMFRGAPTICYMDSDYNDHFEEAILVWEQALWDRWGEDGLFSYMLIDKNTQEFLEYCHVIMVVVEEEYVTDTDETPLGVARSLHTSEYIFLYIFEDRPVMSLEDFDKSMKRTMLHEIGHSFGINHWIGENMSEGLSKPNLLMWQFQWHNDVKIDKHTMDALECLYGKSGFNGNKPVDHCQTFKIYDEI